MNQIQLVLICSFDQSQWFRVNNDNSNIIYKSLDILYMKYNKWPYYYNERSCIIHTKIQGPDSLINLIFFLIKKKKKKNFNEWRNNRYYFCFIELFYYSIIKF